MAFASNPNPEGGSVWSEIQPNRWVTILRNPAFLTFAGGSVCSEIIPEQGGSICPEKGGSVYSEIVKQQLNEAEIVKLRTEKALPVIEALKKWMTAARSGVLPKSPMGKAIDYTLSRIDALKIYTNNGNLQIDNNLVENAIRPVALGRKNYLFAGSHETAQNAAMFYSLFATCKAKGINPYEWLATTLKKIASHPINRIEELLPD